MLSENQQSSKWIQQLSKLNQRLSKLNQQWSKWLFSHALNPLINQSDCRICLSYSLVQLILLHSRNGKMQTYMNESPVVLNNVIDSLHLIFEISVLLPSNIIKHGISNPPWDKSDEDLLQPVISHFILPPRRRISEHTQEIFRSRCTTVVSSSSSTSMWHLYTTAMV